MDQFRTFRCIAAALPLAFAAAVAHAGAPTDSAHAGHTGHAGHASHADHHNHGAAAAPVEALAHADHADHAGHGGNAKPEEKAVVRFAEVDLTDQNGTTLRLERDVVADNIVVVDFVYTSCTTVCPVVSAIMGEVQAQLGERVGRDVRLVSLSVDPQRDTPARLKSYAGTHRAGKGWVWLTGSVPAVNDTLKGFGTWTPNFEDHPVVMMVGDGRSGEWTRFYGFVDPAALVAKVEQLTAQRRSQGVK